MATAPTQFEHQTMMAADPAYAKAAVYEAARGIIGRLEALAQQQQASKALIEERWLADLRAYYGHNPTLIETRLKTAKRSRAFVKLTRHKTNGWAAWLNDLLFPTDERNWAIQPTPLPSLIGSAKQAQLAAAAKVDEANAQADAAETSATPGEAEQLHRQARATAEQADSYARAAKQTQAEIDEATQRCERMQQAILDQFTESDYAAQCRDVLEDGCKIGTGILKGPLKSNRLRAEWRQNELKGRWELTQIPDPQPQFIRVDPWHFFPDMSARTIREAEFSFERSLPTKKDLRLLARRFGFDKDAVRRLLDQGPGLVPGTDLTFLTNLRDMTGEGEGIRGRYVMWEYHGPLECEDVILLLQAAGKTDLAASYEQDRDPLEEYRVIIRFCNNELLKIEEEYPLDSGEPLYSVWNFEKGEATMFGIGVPYIMRDSQKALNGAWRMMMDNSGLSVGPQIVIDKSAVVPQDQDWALRPLKIWLKTSTALQSAKNPPFEVHNIPNNQAQLQGIIGLAKQFADDETSLPLLAQGEQGNASTTLGGMSMLQNSGAVMRRRVVKSWDDDLTKPTLRRAYDWNMQFNPDETVKGDMQVDARGTSALLVREIQSVHLMSIAQTWSNHPVLQYFVKTYDVAAKALESLMIKPADLLYSKEEAEDRMKEAQQAAAQSGQDGSAELRLKVAEIEAESRQKVAEMQRDTAMAELALRDKVSLADIQAKFGIKQAEIDSQERRHAADIGIEEQRARRETEAGRPPAAVEGAAPG